MFERLRAEKFPPELIPIHKWCDKLITRKNQLLGVDRIIGDNFERITFTFSRKGKLRTSEQNEQADKRIDDSTI